MFDEKELLQLARGYYAGTEHVNKERISGWINGVTWALTNSIKLSPEQYQFLINLSKELNTQDNRFTTEPNFYQVLDYEEIPASMGNGDEIWINDDIVIKTEDEIKETVFEIKNWDSNNNEHQNIYNNFYDYEIDDILKENGYTKHYITTQEVYSNAFLTKKACKEHIAVNKHNYKDPKDFLSYAPKNPELEQLINILKSLTDENISKG